MPTLQDIRRRIRSVKSTRQITRAMKMVAAARLRRAQERIFSARPYACEMMTLLESAAARASGHSHPLLARRPVERTMLVLVTADRGLCGAFNANLVRATEAYLEEHRRLKVSLLAVGRKGRDAFRRRPVTMAGERINLFRKLEFTDARDIAREIIELYTRQSVDAVDVLYNEFKSIMTQRVRIERFLPIAPITPQEGETLVDYIYEQPPGEIFRALLPRYVEIEVYRVLLESQAAEHAARMTAMDSATNNAEELMDTLTLTMNRLRQAAITKEIIEVVSGADALR
jgi:F-type H+-transporting ATPase subunit gamma